MKLQSKTLSPAADAKNNEKPKLEAPRGFSHTYGAGLRVESPVYIHEHDKVASRTTGKKVEIDMGRHGAGLVPANPFASLAQEGYMHAHPGILGKTGLEEWDKETSGRKLPKKVRQHK